MKQACCVKRSFCRAPQQDQDTPLRIACKTNWNLRCKKAADRRLRYAAFGISGILHNNRDDAVTDMLAGVCAGFHALIDLPPGDGQQHIGAVFRQLTHTVEVQLVALLFHIVQLNDQLTDLLGLFKVFELRHDLMQHIAGLDQLLGKFHRSRLNGRNVVDIKLECGQGLKDSRDAIRSILHPWFGYRGYTWNKIYKTDVVKNTEFDMRYSHAEDLLWNVQVLSEMKTIYIDDTIVNMHRILQKSLSHSNVLSPKQLSVFEVREKIIGLLNDEELRSIEKFAYHWDLSLMLKREVLCKNVQGVNLLMSCYRRDYQKDFFKNVSCKAKIENYCLMYRVRAFLKKNDVKAGKL